MTKSGRSFHCLATVNLTHVFFFFWGFFFMILLILLVNKNKGVCLILKDDSEYGYRSKLKAYNKSRGLNGKRISYSHC